MDELPVIDVYSDVTLRTARFEKNQISKFQGFFCDGFSGFGEPFGGTRCFFVEYIAKGYVYKPGAIDASFAEASQFIGCVFPGRIVFGQCSLLAGLGT